jgi:hypothetical protein
MELSPHILATSPIHDLFKVNYLYSAPTSFTLDSNADLMNHIFVFTSSAKISTVLIFPPASATFYILEAAPSKTESTLVTYRTAMIEYLQVTHGGVVLEHLDGGEKSVVKKGDAIVRRTWHA